MAFSYSVRASSFPLGILAEVTVNKLREPGSKDQQLGKLARYKEALMLAYNCYVDKILDAVECKV